MSDVTALSSCIPAPCADLVLEARLRFLLDEMATCLDNAHMATRGSAAVHLLLGRAYARLAVRPGHRCFNIEAVGASFRTGPYVGLSVMANVLAAEGLIPKVKHRSEYAELAWHARDLLDGVSPLDPEVMQADFQDCHWRLSALVYKESDRR